LNKELVLDLIVIYSTLEHLLLPVHNNAMTFEIAGILKVTSLKTPDMKRNVKYLKSSL